MTSPSRKKRPTTRPSSTPKSDVTFHIKPRPAVAVLRTPVSIGNLQSLSRIAACGLAITLFAATASAENLKWQRGRSEVKIKSTATSSFSQNTTLAPSSTTTASTYANPLRASYRRVDLAVRQAAFEDNGPEFGRSVVVREEEPNAIRSAQLESPSTADADAQLEEDLRNPLIDTSTDLPPLDEPPMDIDTAAPPQDTTPQQDPNQFQQQPIGQQPFQQQPPAQFQPNVPGRPEVAPPLPADVPPLSEDTIETERQKSQAACAEGLEDLNEKTIDKLSLVITVTGEEGADFPYECTLGESWHEGRCWEQNTYMWKASALCHKPLYFEEEQLERYGHSFAPCFQPFVSGAHFFTRPFVLPYCMGVEPPCECIYALGHYRPGNCAPYMCNPIPLSPRGALFQAGAVVGTAAALP
jgi:hypothetical protein